MTDPYNVVLQEKNVSLSQWFNQMMKLEKIKWAKKSRQAWTQLGDKNTRYFQMIALNRMRKNKTWKIWNSEGIWFDNQNEIANVFINDFSKRFTSENLIINHELFYSFSPCITKEENRELIKDVIEVEIHAALSQINSLKAPTLDGLQASFYQKYWKIIGKSVCKMVKALFYNGHMLKEINRTFITLIPKSDNPKSSNHYKPINLCNVCYQIIAKILANRVKPLINKIVSPLQGAFALGRLINDNVLLAHEIMHLFKKKKIKSSYMTIKLDMEKNIW